GHVMLETRQQEGPEFAPVRARRLEPALFFQEMNEESLHQILRVMRLASAPAQKRVERIPVNAAQLFESLRGPGRLLIRRRQNHAPLRLTKLSRGPRRIRC